MHILHVAASLNPTSAAGRLCTALQEASVKISTIGIDGPFFEGAYKFDDYPFLRKHRRRVARGLLRCFYPQKDSALPWSLSLCGYDLRQYIQRIRPDILHLHWIADSTINLESLSKISIPIIWTCHDVWPLTGGCHCELGCLKWQTGCHQCHQLGKSFAKIDLAQWAWKRKKKLLGSLTQLSAIAPSVWMLSMLKKSPMWQGKTIFKIGNTIDTNIFSPRDKIHCREKFRIPKDALTVLFGATDITLPYKGFSFLRDALYLLRNKLNIHLLIFGESHSVVDVPCTVSFLGKIQSNNLSEIYSLADVLVSPTLQESFGMVIGEASACGLPCVAFKTGGVTEIIKHNYSGFLVDVGNVTELAKYIEILLTKEVLRKRFSLNAISVINKNFSNKIIANQHIKIYEQLLG